MIYAWTIIIGFVAAVIVQVVTPGHDQPSTFMRTAIVGIAGALVGTWIGRALGLDAFGQREVLAGALVGAVVILLAWSGLSPRLKG